MKRITSTAQLIQLARDCIGDNDAARFCVDTAYHCYADGRDWGARENALRAIRYSHGVNSAQYQHAFAASLRLNDCDVEALS